MRRPGQAPPNGAEPIDRQALEPAGGMEVGEALQRIFKVHLVLVLGCVLLGGAVGFGLHIRDQPMYAASARVVLDTADPTGQSDSEAYAAGARGIVTSPSHVAGALQAIHVQRDATTVAANDVTLAPMATSSVEQVTVTDRDPVVAAALANALAADLVKTRLQLRTAGGPPAPQQVAAVQSNIDRVDAQVASVNSQIQNAQPADVQRLSALISSLIAERASLVQQENSLASQRSPIVIDPATRPQHPVSRGTLPDIGLGLLLGFAAGVTAAAILEVMRPTLPSPRAIARAVGAPLLGKVTPAVSGSGLEPDAQARVRLRHVADMEGIQSVQLGVARSRVQVRSHAGLGRHWRSPAPHEATATGEKPPRGFVLITPSVVKKAEVERVMESLPFSDEQLLGVLTYRPRPRWVPRPFWWKA